MTWQDWVTIAGLPLLVLGYIEAYTKYGPAMANYRRPLGFVLIGVAVVLYVLDIADRFGAFGPTKSELVQKVSDLQGKADYRLVVIQGKDGKGGLKAALAATQWPKPYNPVVVSGQTFENETVPLDGHRYVNSTFKNVMFEYDGKTPFVFDPKDNNKIVGIARFRTNNPVFYAGFNAGIGYQSAMDERTKPRATKSKQAQDSGPCFGGHWGDVNVEGYVTGMSVPSCFSGTVDKFTYKSGLPPGVTDNRLKAAVVRSPGEPSDPSTSH